MGAGNLCDGSIANFLVGIETVSNNTMRERECVCVYKACCVSVDEIGGTQETPKSTGGTRSPRDDDDDDISILSSAFHEILLTEQTRKTQSSM